MWKQPPNPPRGHLKVLEYLGLCSAHLKTIIETNLQAENSPVVNRPYFCEQGPSGRLPCNKEALAEQPPLGSGGLGYNVTCIACSTEFEARGTHFEELTWACRPGFYVCGACKQTENRNG